MVQMGAGYPSLLLLLLRLLSNDVSAKESNSDNIPQLQLVHDRTQRIEGGKHIHFHVPNTVCPSQTALKIVLETLEGDADLYVSSSGQEPKPTYRNYGLKSTTYGIDEVNVPRSLARPLAIGVYAHPFYESSVFRMRIYIDPFNSVDEFERVRLASYSSQKSYEELSGSDIYDKQRQSRSQDRQMDSERGGHKPPKSESNIAGGGKKSTRRVEEKSSWVTTLLLHVLEFMVEVFL